MENEKTQFDRYWKPVVGMENVQELMKTYATMASDTLIEQVKSGKKMLVTSFTNGGLNPLIFIMAELKKRYYEGDIDSTTLDAITDHIALFETKREGGPQKRKIDIITSEQYRNNRLYGDETWQNPDLIVLVDDIVEGTTTAGLLDQSFPDTPKMYMAPVIKHVTHSNMNGNPHPLLFITELENDWDDSGCGMNGGIFFKDIEPYENHEIEVLQRYSNTGYYHDPKDTQTIAHLGDLHRNRLLTEQLPWMHLQDMHLDLARLEELKNHRQFEKQLQAAEQILERAKNVTYNEALSILTASY